MHVRALVVTGMALVLCASCAGTKKVELEYDEPVTKTWTGTGVQPPAQPEPAAQGLPAQQLPQTSLPPQAQGLPAGSAPGPTPPVAGQPAAPPPSPAAWRNAQPTSPPPLNFPDPSATTVVVPDQNPTTQTTLKKRSGWVRGGFD